MKISHFQWPALVLAAVLGWNRLAVSSEPLADNKVTNSATPRKRASSGEARGILTSSFWSGESNSSESAQRQPTTQGANQPAVQSMAQPAAPVAGPAVVEAAADPLFQQASWTNNLGSNLGGGGMGPSQAPEHSSGCTSCNICDDCCPNPMWLHRHGVFADLLYIRPGNIDYVYAVEQTGPLPTDSPTGPTGRVGFDADLGFRVGGSIAFSECSSIVASYTWFETDTQNTITAQPGNVLVFQPGDPSIPNTGATAVQASANYFLRFQQVDIDFRQLLYGDCESAVNYFAGVRYANLKQTFGAREDIGVPFGLANVNTEINFDGFGIGFGLDAMRRSAYSGLLVYGKASSSFVAGEFKADYLETTQFGPNSIIANTLVDYRVMTILQSEIGLGWESECGTVRLTGGYMFAGWFNALTTGTYILGVQNREFSQLFETISFDGFVSRVEVRW